LNLVKQAEAPAVAGVLSLFIFLPKNYFEG
jgi:hypothetical protein